MQRIILVSKLSPQEVEGVLFDLIEGFSTKVSTNIREGESHFDVKKKKFNTGWKAATDQTFESSITWRYIYFISISWKLFFSSYHYLALQMFLAWMSGALEMFWAWKSGVLSLTPQHSIHYRQWQCLLSCHSCNNIFSGIFFFHRSRSSFHLSGKH